MAPEAIKKKKYSEKSDGKLRWKFFSDSDQFGLSE
jgi:hypothetical protein